MKLHILRDGQELGELLASDARDLLQAGFLRTSDEFWVDDLETRQPLARLLEAETASRPHWLTRARKSVASASGTVRTRTADLSGKVSALVRRGQADMASSTVRALEGYLPQLRELTSERLGKMVRSTESALHDEEFLRKLFGAVYDCLPKPIRRFVGESAFVEFCLKHRQRLLP